MPTATETPVTIDWMALSNQIANYLNSQKFVPGTIRQGSVYVEDLTSGQSITVNDHVRYSAVSTIKIGVLVTLYQTLAVPPTHAEAVLIAKMMICSDNSATNALLRLIGNGNLMQGSAIVTETLHTLGLTTTLLTRPLSDISNQTDPNAPLDPTSADADPSNFTTPSNLGKLAAAIYHCARNESSPLNTALGNAVTPAECRQMIYVMRANHMEALITAGVPVNVPVAHKQGWDDETHADVAIITTRGGAYALVIMLHNRQWLNYTNSFPTMSEVSRLTYNAYNPARALAAIHPKPIPRDCLIPDAVLTTLQQADAPALAGIDPVQAS
ncbi:MAG: serine hydrolase [Aggregatilineales bacterium]